MSSHNPYLKRREALVIGREATRGGSATPDYTFRWNTKGLRTVPGIIENESGVGDDYRVNDSAIDVNHSEGPIGGKVAEDGIAHLERWIMPKVTTVDNEDGTYTHTFEYDPSIEAASYSVWDVRPASTRLFKSVVLDNLELSVEVSDSGAWLMASTAAKGWKHQNVTAITPALDVDEKEFTTRHVKVYLADDVAGLANESARVRARRWSLIREQTKNIDHALGEGDTPEFDKSVFEARGELVVKYRKTDYEEGHFTNKKWAMKTVIVNGDVKIEYIASKVGLREVTDSDGIDDIVTQQMSYYCEADHANGGAPIIVKVTNTMATI